MEPRCFTKDQLPGTAAWRAPGANCRPRDLVRDAGGEECSVARNIVVMVMSDVLVRGQVVTNRVVRDEVLVSGQVVSGDER